MQEGMEAGAEEDGEWGDDKAASVLKRGKPTSRSAHSLAVFQHRNFSGSKSKDLSSLSPELS